jgi:hypothetical protein
MTMLDERVGTREEIKTSDSPGDSAHIVRVPPGEPDITPQAYVLRARIEGFAVTAICGYTWVPQKKAEGLPVCGRCLEIYQTPGKNRDERDELPDE